MSATTTAVMATQMTPMQRSGFMPILELRMKGRRQYPAKPKNTTNPINSSAFGSGTAAMVEHVKKVKSPWLVPLLSDARPAAQISISPIFEEGGAHANTQDGVAEGALWVK